MKVYFLPPTNPLDALLFKESFESARLFNSTLKQGLLGDLLFAPLYEEAPAPFDSPDDPVDNPDINKEPEEHDHQDAFGAEDD
jgi:hypothetical protein